MQNLNLITYIISALVLNWGIFQSYMGTYSVVFDSYYDHLNYE
jgi:TM2 domain-containing membrane protein YozV